MQDVLNHLVQSTVFAGLIAIAVLLLKRNPARVRYALWLAASLKFLVPFSVLLALGTRVDAPPVARAMTASVVEQVSASFAPVPSMHSTVARASAPVWPSVVLAAWGLGALFIAARWLRTWLSIRAARRAAELLPVAAPIPVFSSPLPIEPGVFGIVRPVLLLPQGILQNLPPAQLDAILAHELSHVRRRDNLTAAIHMFVQTMFWFHPLVWWIGSKLVEERERACDETVLAGGSDAKAYATGILGVCRHYVETPLFCAAGVSGGQLRRRITEIMTWRNPMHMSIASKVALAIAGAAILAAPVAIGILRAQTLPPAPQYKFEVASIKPSKAVDDNSRLGPYQQGGIRAENVTPLQLIEFAFRVRPFQIVGGPRWAHSDRFDVIATPDKPEPQPPFTAPREQLEAYMKRAGERVQALLTERFGLVLKAETRLMPVYSLVIAKGGHKLQPTESQSNPGVRSGPRQITTVAANMKELAFTLAGILGQPVLDDTGVAGLFDMKLEWTPDAQAAEAAGQPAGPSIFTAIQEQLGLKLETKKAPQPVYVIEKIDRPSEN